MTESYWSHLEKGTLCSFAMSIKAIDKSTVHKICSGQVIVDLASAVKEMVENALDAGATIIEVKLKNMGVDSIEVSDNGVGIDPCNYDGIAMKHHTSKLADFKDVYKVESFGFRGEALNALCELSDKFYVTTRQASQATATLLNFDSAGRVVSQQVVPRSVGTSVVVEGLFGKLPVRRGEFVRSGKKQYVKMLKIIQSYALISVGIQIVITNVTNGGKQSVLATQTGTKSLLDTTSILFGSSFAGSLLPLSVSLVIDTKALAVVDTAATESAETTETNIEPEDCEIMQPVSAGDPDRVAISPPLISLTGFVSKVGVGVGRSDNDRQFIFCNGRPVDNHRINRVANEVWRRYEMKQKPAFIFDIRVPTGYYDVNVTPDKREVFIVQEASLLDQLRAAMDMLYEPSRYTMTSSNSQHVTTGIVAESTLSASSIASNKALSVSQQSSTNTCISNSSQESVLVEESAMPSISKEVMDVTSSNSSAPAVLETAVPYSSVRPPPSPLFASAGATAVPAASGASTSAPAAPPQRSFPPGTRGSVPAASAASSSGPSSSSVSGGKSTAATVTSTANVTVAVSTFKQSNTVSLPSNGKLTSSQGASFSDSGNSTSSASLAVFDLENTQDDNSRPTSQSDAASSSTVMDLTQSSELDRVYSSVISSIEVTTSEIVPGATVVPAASSGVSSSGSTIQVNADEILSSVKRNARYWSDSTAGTRDLIDEYKRRRTESRTNTDSSRSGVAGEDGDSAAGGLMSDMSERRLSKQDFPRMNVLGQFNVGFVIVELDGDLYIVDPHACDEKYRFENLQRSTKIHQQPLISPLVLQTSVAQEIVIMDNLHVFEENGFKLQVNNSDSVVDTGDSVSSGDYPGKRQGRISLLAVPFSKTIQFGVDDVNELASMIGEDCYYGGGSEGVSSGGGAGEGGGRSSGMEKDLNDRMSKNYLLLKNDAVRRSGDSDSSGSSNSGSGKKYRLPKLVAMYASRACRSAVMLGTALSHPEMRTIVSQMESVEQPWNCPHGRPTMRHLFDLSQLPVTGP